MTRPVGSLAWNMFKHICVFSSSSDAVAPEYFEAAREVGAQLARKQMTLVYQERFTRSEHRELYHVAATPEDVFAYLEAYRPPKTAPKWSSTR